MHPIYASAGEAQAVPILFVNAGNFAATVCGSRCAGAGLYPRRRLRTQAGTPSAAAEGGRQVGRRPVRHRSGRRAGRRTCFARASSRACCRPAPIVSPTRRMTRGLPRLPSRSAPISSAATARASRAMCALALPQGVDGDDLTRIAEARDAGARSHQYAVERHGAGRTGRRRAQTGRAAWRVLRRHPRQRAGQAISAGRTPSAAARRARRA